MESSSSLPLFEAISASDTEALVHLYGHAAVNALIQYLHHNAGSVPSTGWDRTTDRGMCVRFFEVRAVGGRILCEQRFR